MRAKRVCIFRPNKDERPSGDDAPLVADEVEALPALNPEDFVKIVTVEICGPRCADLQAGKVMSLSFVYEILKQEFSNGHQYSIINMWPATRRFSPKSLCFDYEHNASSPSDG